METSHRNLKGVQPSDAEMTYLERVKWLDMYGVDLHPVIVSSHTHCFVQNSKGRQSDGSLAPPTRTLAPKVVKNFLSLSPLVPISSLIPPPFAGGGGGGSSYVPASINFGLASHVLVSL